ncbi:FkbM family methyltransferase [Candidatus Synechococcus calcipolaris G9]|uniref:FkbM family methyltransferase n=1 Tax=Candidatus Synechococcus calcipolaris G9 TaxID=1497997 RepID=A0ABT6F014_9SYNE|nr:FkbM family methyltransferase [Candidatus Synechococcus calcipolaris]MDG2991211.1 FkbM family methyltransferase [Candidatus Synechococcus calcipolaris G9]
MIFLQELKRLGLLDSLHITIAQIGSRKLSLNDDLGSQEWQIFAPNLTIYGFDADVDACEAANQDLQERAPNWNEIHLPIALGRETTEVTLYVTKNPFCSSLYPPDENFVNRFPRVGHHSSLDFTVEIDVMALDDFLDQEKINSIDVLIIDVQGADLDVLQGGQKILAQSVAAIQTEIEFNSLYIGQPLFADVDQFLRANGFSLFDFNLAYRPRTEVFLPPPYRRGQLLWGDGYYIRDLIKDDSSNWLTQDGKIFKLACIADCWGFSDYALELYAYILKNFPESSFVQLGMKQAVIDSLLAIPDVTEMGIESLSILEDI